MNSKIHSLMVSYVKFISLDFWIWGPNDLRNIQIRQLISAYDPCCSTSNDSTHQAEQELTIN